MSVQDYTFTLGDFIKITLRDGAVFSGVVNRVDLQYVVLNGYGFPIEDIAEWAHA